MSKKVTAKDKNRTTDYLSSLAEKNLSEDKELNFELQGMNRRGGFIQVLDILTSYVDLNLYDRLVYSALRNYAEADMTKQLKTNITNEGLSARLGISKSTIINSLSKLQSLGIINMYKHPTKYERVIQIRRDFREKQKEELEAEQRAEQGIVMPTNNESNLPDDDIEW